jgi:Tol biopolymer transport system component
LFISDRDEGTYHLFAVDRHGSNLKRILLATDAERDVTSASWSPTQHAVVYSTREHFRSTVLLTPTVFVADLITGQSITLAPKAGLACDRPEWSPQADWIVMICTKRGEASGIYLAAPDGSQWKEVTPPLVGYQVQNKDVWWVNWIWEVHWSPDGKAIVYEAAPDGVWSTFVMNADGTEPRRLMSDSEVQMQPPLSIYRLP